MARARRPAGQATRGKTAANRLRRLDAYLAACESSLLRRGPEPLVVDLGFGATPGTTVEMADRLAQVASVRVVGVEIDRDRVAAAASAERSGLSFVLGGFDFETETPATIIRALNVLRQYDEAEIVPAWTQLGERLVDGGLLVEGTSDPHGRLMVVNLLRRRDDRLEHEGVLFSVRLTADFHPRDLQAVLPKNLIHHVVPGEPVHELFDDWSSCWQRARTRRSFGQRAVLDESLRLLADGPHRLDPRRWLARRGFVLWRGLGDDPGAGLAEPSPLTALAAPGRRQGGLRSGSDRTRR
ncbi:MAG: class I SAM-dependent methyltransferase [Acidobacteriota bacterium]